MKKNKLEHNMLTELKDQVKQLERCQIYFIHFSSDSKNGFYDYFLFIHFLGGLLPTVLPLRLMQRR